MLLSDSQNILNMVRTWRKRNHFTLLVGMHISTAVTETVWKSFKNMQTKNCLNVKCKIAKFIERKQNNSYQRLRLGRSGKHLLKDTYFIYSQSRRPIVQHGDCSKLQWSLFFQIGKGRFYLFSLQKKITITWGTVC